MSRTSVTRLLTLAALAGCAAGASPLDRDRLGGESECSAESAHRLIGQPATAENRREALRLTGAGLLRVLRPGDGATADYQTGRLNIIVDAADIIRELRCG